MKKFLFFLVIIVATIKITLFVNKKQTEKLLLEKRNKEALYTKEELSDLSKGMYNYNYLNYKIKKELRTGLRERAAVPSTEVKPLYPNRRFNNLPNNNDADDEESYIKNDANDRLYYKNENSDNSNDNDEDTGDNNSFSNDDEANENDTDENKPSTESIKRINSLKELIKNNLHKTNSMDNPDDEDYINEDENENDSKRDGETYMEEGPRE